LYNGDIIGCCADWNRESVLGNIANNTIEEVIFGKEAQRRRNLISSSNYNNLTPCKTCSQAQNIMANIAP
jgi:radical SAM protein with 4Fe4S-binding SPASM domain